MNAAVRIGQSKRRTAETGRFDLHRQQRKSLFQDRIDHRLIVLNAVIDDIVKAVIVFDIHAVEIVSIRVIRKLLNVADGLKGTDEELVPVEGGEYVKEAKIGKAIMDADIFISLAHFKGHEGTGFGGTLKNIGMGCGSRAGKMEQHSSGKPHVSQKRCVGCKLCTKICAHSAITVTDKKASIDHNKCVGCGRCIGVCHQDAVLPASDESNDILNRKIAEYSKAVVSGRPAFYINMVIDVSPYCDCHGENDAAIVPDVGFFASFDPVALDVACADAVNKQPIIANSLLGDHQHIHEGDYFHKVSPETNWMSGIEHAEKIGLGTREYELITV